MTLQIPKLPSSTSIVALLTSILTPMFDKVSKKLIPAFINCYKNILKQL